MTRPPYVLALLAAAVLGALSCAASAPHPDGIACLEQCHKKCENWVVVEFDVSDTGRVLDPKVVEYCPDSGFNWTAVESVRKWKYGRKNYGNRGLKVKLIR